MNEYMIVFGMLDMNEILLGRNDDNIQIENVFKNKLLFFIMISKRFESYF